MGADGRGLQRELRAGLQRGARPAINAIRQEALQTLPASGGKQVRKMKIVGRTTVDGKEFKVRARAGKLQDNESLAHRVSNASYTLRLVTGRGIAQLQIRGRAKGGKTLDLKSINDGIVRHPVFGDRGSWVAQPVRPGFFTRACEANRDAVLQGIREAAENVAEQLRQATH
jgi:hypothetical protein